MKITITGATGGLGRNLVRHFVSEGHAVTGLGRNERAGREIEKDGASFQQGDLSDVDYLRRAFRKSDVVVHSAALASPWGNWSDFEDANVKGTENVVHAASELALQRFVHVSTPSIYFDGRPRTDIKEDSTLPEPRTHYARSKILAETIVTRAVHERGLPALILRPRAIFGPFDSAILPRLIRIMDTGIFPLPANGEARMNVTAVGNVVHAVGLCLTADAKFFGRAYNITNDQVLTLSELVHLVASALDLKVKFIPVPLAPMVAIAKLSELFADYITHREPKLTRYSVGLLGCTQTLDISRAKAELGYEPLVSVAEGLALFAEWWRSRSSH